MNSGDREQLTALAPGEAIHARVTGTTLRLDTADTADTAAAAAAEPSGPVGAGTATLTSHRLIWAGDAAAVAWSIPMAVISEAHYAQPWFFGANNLSANASTARAEPVTFTLSFDNGGGDSFMGAWAHAAARQAVQRAPAPPTVGDAAGPGPPTAPAEPSHLVPPGGGDDVAYFSRGEPGTIYRAAAGSAPGFGAHTKKNS